LPKPTLPLDGGCRCGQIRLRIKAQPLLTMACHCSGCQKMSASAFSLSAAIPTEGFEILQGEPVIGGMHAPDLNHYHCPHCKSWLFTRMPGMDSFVNVRPTMLDDAQWFSPYVETCVSEKLPWATTPAVHSFEVFPPMDTFGPLAQEYAAQD
jgi:hypothetical protein